MLEAGEDAVAAIVCTPHRHDVYIDQEPGRSGVRPRRPRDLRPRRRGADHRRRPLRPAHRSARRLGRASGSRPDLSAWSKSLANGYPLAALLGTAPLAAIGRGPDHRHRLVLVRRRPDGRGADDDPPAQGDRRHRPHARRRHAPPGGAARAGRRRTAWPSASPARRRCRCCCSPTIPSSPERSPGREPAPRTASTCTRCTTGSCSTAHDEATIDEAPGAHRRRVRRGPRPLRGELSR